MSRPPVCWQDESGQVIPFVAIGMVLFVLFLALAVNVGLWYDTDSGLQKAADLSALAGAQYLATDGAITAPGYPCASAAGVTTAVGCATRVASLNGIASPETAAASQVTLEGSQAVKVATQHPNEMGIFYSSTRSESAIAVVAGINGGLNSLPAIFEVPPSGTLQYGVDTMFTFGTAPSPGAFNLTVACGGNPSESDLKQCFECTQTYTITPAGLQPNPLPAGANCAQRSACAGTQVGSAPGNKLNKNVADVINTYLNDVVVLIPMYDTAPTGSGGSNITYTIAGFAELLMDSPAATGGNGSNPVVLHGIFQKVVAPDAVEGTCQGTGLDLGATTFYLAG